MTDPALSELDQLLEGEGLDESTIEDTVAWAHARARQIVGELEPESDLRELLEGGEIPGDLAPVREPRRERAPLPPIPSQARAQENDDVEDEDEDEEIEEIDDIELLEDDDLELIEEADDEEQPPAPAKKPGADEGVENLVADLLAEQGMESGLHKLPEQDEAPEEAPDLAQDVDRDASESGVDDRLLDGEDIDLSDLDNFDDLND